jgi:hypothetical protein
MNYEAPLKDGTTYQDFLENSASYRHQINERFAQEVLHSPISKEELKIYGRSFVKELIPERSDFVHEEDYDEIYQETLYSLVGEFF